MSSGLESSASDIAAFRRRSWHCSYVLCHDICGLIFIFSGLVSISLTPVLLAALVRVSILGESFCLTQIFNEVLLLFLTGYSVLFSNLLFLSKIGCVCLWF